MHIRNTILFSLLGVLVFIFVALAWMGTRGQALYEQKMTRYHHADLLHESADSARLAAHQFFAFVENSPPESHTGSPTEYLAPYMIDDASTHYLFLDPQGAPLPGATIDPALKPLLAPSVLKRFFADVRDGGPDQLAVDNYKAVLRGEESVPHIIHFHAYPDRDLIVGVGRTQSATGVRLAALSDTSGDTVQRLAQLGGAIYAILALAALSIAGLVLHWMFFRPLARLFKTNAADGKAAGVTWAQMKEYAARLQTITQEMDRIRERLEREVEARFRAEEERDLLRNTQAHAQKKYETEIRSHFQRELQEAQAQLMQREARVLHRHLAEPLKEARTQAAEGDREAAVRTLDACLSTVQGLGDQKHDLPHAPQRLALQPWLEDVVARFRDSHPVAIQTNINNGMLVDIDPSSLRHAIEYVLENAFQVSPDGRSISVDANQAEGRVEIRVVDRGAGIPEYARSHILVPFYSLREGGDGLGLAITRSVIEQHGGRLEILTELDKGTAVIITLPIAR